MTETISCPFCDPLERVVKSNDSAQMLLSDPRKVPGHTLVMPKRHVEKPWELTAEELQDIFALINFVEQRVVGKLGTGCDIRQGYKPFLKQDALKVNHLTFHVIPRAKDDYLYSVSEKYEEDLFAELDDLERDEVTKLLVD
ncbi:HIT domain-containing protein [Polaromonas sp.]|nr:HIT domain-containing protein [Candidatus Saccharibacteria bacterium]